MGGGLAWAGWAWAADRYGWDDDEADETDQAHAADQTEAADHADETDQAHAADQTEAADQADEDHDEADEDRE